ncbi:MAG: tetraacyldisaccharide 4'-kinase [Helicobacter sp.]|nr:tetraacyldisaccharide 4'-kinase [Helicobacter sp.]
MRFIDSYFYNPSFAQKLLSFVLLPVSLLYAISATLRRKCSKYYDFGIPIISVGNLIIGGSGKTPFIIEIAKSYRTGSGSAPRSAGTRRPPAPPAHRAHCRCWR